MGGGGRRKSKITQTLIDIQTMLTTAYTTGMSASKLHAFTKVIERYSVSKVAASARSQ